MGAQRSETRPKSSIPVFDAKRQYSSIKTDINHVALSVLSSGCYVDGPRTQEFEEKLAAYCGTKYAVAVSNGTAAIYLALIESGIAAGDEVLVPSHTFIATIEAIELAMATPVYCDISPYTYNIRMDEIEKKKTDNTKAIVPVHMYGNMCGMRDIIDFAKEHSLTVIEDACQAIGSEQNGRKAGSFGDYGCFSFYPTKNLGACGEGGAVVTNNKASYQALCKLRNHNATSKYDHAPGGFNFRISEIQAAILSAKIRHLNGWITRRREIASIYDGGLHNVTKPEETKGNMHTYHLYAVRSDTRQRLCKHLERRGIGYGLHYPIPCHEQFGHKAELPFTRLVAGQVISIPMFPELTDDEVRRVIEAVNEA